MYVFLQVVNVSFVSLRVHVGVLQLLCPTLTTLCACLRDTAYISAAEEHGRLLD